MKAYLQCGKVVLKKTIRYISHKEGYILVYTSKRLVSCFE